MRKLTALALVVILGTATACGSDETTATTEAAVTSSSPAETTIAADTTVAVEATEAEHTGDKVPLNCAAGTEFEDDDGDGWGDCVTPELSNEISRSTAVAVNKCFDLWWSLRQFRDVYEAADIDVAIEACEDAAGELEVDQMDVPVGPSPVNQLALAVSTVSLTLGIANLEATMQQCEFCVPMEPEKFAEYIPAAGQLDLDEILEEVPLASAPTVEDFGITIAG